MSYKLLFFLICSLILFGIVFTYSLSVYFVNLKGMNHYHFLSRSIFFGVVGILIMWSISKLDPDKYLHTIGLYLLAIPFGLLIIIMKYLPESIVPTINGAKRWVNIGAFNLAPMEFFKIGFIYFLAWSFNRTISNKEKVPFRQEIKILVPYLVVLAVIGGFAVMYLNDYGQTMLIVGLFILMGLIAGGSYRMFFSMLSAGVVSLAILIFAKPHRIGRLKSWWIERQDLYLDYFPDFLIPYLKVDNINTTSQQVEQGIYAIHNGGLFGLGIGNGIYKLGYVSDIHTDFVLAGIAEEIGLFGIILISAIYFFVIYEIIFNIGKKSKQEYKLFCSGFAILIALQFLINALGISGAIPLKGMTVPFLSYGGSSLLALCIGAGMVLMIKKRVKI